MAQGKGVKIWGEPKGGVILGRDEFAREVKAMVKGKRPAPKRGSSIVRPGLEELFGDVKGGEDRDERIY